MNLGYKELDENEQKLAKSSFTFHTRMRKIELVFLMVLFAICTISTIVFGIWSIVDATKINSFFAYGMMTILFLVVFAIGQMIFKFIKWMMRRMNDGENLPLLQKRSLKSILNYMHGNIGGMIWAILWGTIVFSVIIVCLGEGAFILEDLPTIVQTGLKMMLVFLVGHIFFRLIHSHSNYTKKMLENTKEYYNYGNGTNDGKRYAEHIDWSMRENMQFCCKQIVLTKEIVLGYAHTDSWFYPVAIPRDFIKEAEYREILWSNSKISACTGVLACKLNNDKVIDFYLSRGMGNARVVELLQKYGMEFTIRNDMMEYQ